MLYEDAYDEQTRLESTLILMLGTDCRLTNTPQRLQFMN